MFRPRFVALEEEIANRFRQKPELAEGPVTLLQAMFKDVRIGQLYFFLCSLRFSPPVPHFTPYDSLMIAH